jgi:hypothetical protein
MPAVSVTVLGVVAGFIGLLLVRHRSWSSMVHGIAGAWVGFIAGAIVAIILDVVLGSGTLLPVLGHAAAAAGALVAVIRLRSRSDLTAHRAVPPSAPG